MSGLKAVIFDFDGTLVQLRPGPGQMDALRGRLGLLFEEVGIRSMLRPFYPELDHALSALRQRGDARGKQIEAQAIALIEEYETHFSQSSEPCPHVVAAWRDVASQFPCGISSSNTRSSILQSLILHGIWDKQESFPLVGFEDVDRHKPDPAPLAKLANILRLGPGDVAAHVGDHVNDLEACRRFNDRGGAQLLPIMVQGGKCKWEDVVAHPNFSKERGLSDLSELLPVLRAIKTPG